ncbi:MAG: ComEC/Rec2 family competence protein [Planctomycetota bacterium]|nr:ComEC/Rec2 family competence protein [Planctomycetota bacterium]
MWPFAIAWGLWIGAAAGVSNDVADPSVVALQSLAAVGVATLGFLALTHARGVAARTLGRAGAVCVSVALGWFIGCEERASFERSASMVVDPGGALVHLVIEIGQPRALRSRFDADTPSFSGTLIALETDQGRVDVGRPVSIRVDGATKSGGCSIEPGQCLFTFAWWKPPERDEELKAWMPWILTAGSVGSITIPSSTHQVIAHPSWIDGCWAASRSATAVALRESLNAWTDRPSRSIFACMVLGTERDGARDSLREFSRAGITHLIAISGFNLTVLVICVVWCGRWFHLQHRARGAVLCVVVFLFALSVQPDVSAMRAASMSGVCAALVLVGWKLRAMNVLAWVAIILILDDPRAAIRPGFQLSVAAVIALLAIQQRMLERDASATSSSILVRFLVGVWHGFVLSSLIWIATAPIVWCHFGTISFLGAPLTVIAAPISAAAIVLGSIAVPVALVSPQLAAIFAIPGSAMAWCLVKLAAIGSACPGATLELDPLSGPVATIMVIVMLGWLNRPLSRSEPLLDREVSLL